MLYTLTKQFLNLKAIFSSHKAKRDNITKTGKGGMGKYTEVDELVLDILGKESPLICGLGKRKRSTTPKRLKLDDEQRDSEKDKLMKEFFILQYSRQN
ncbi:hypothetical protein Avbf_14942 [Armadillidium vulgare]|nr:hypothetical protein Avbf_14942 [Armadillidium vulgare]